MGCLGQSLNYSWTEIMGSGPNQLGHRAHMGCLGQSLNYIVGQK